MPPPLNVKSLKTKKSAERQEDPLIKALNSHSRHSTQLGKQRSVQKAPSKSSSALNVSKISQVYDGEEHPSDKFHTSGSERQSSTDMARKTKLNEPKLGGNVFMFAGHLDSGFGTSRRGSFTSNVSSSSERSISRRSEEKMTGYELKKY